MKNIQAQYQDLLEGKMSKSNFMRNVRMQFPQHVSPSTSFDDSVKILKGKRILSEAKKPEGVYGHNPNAEMDEYRGIDHLNYYQVYHGIQYELAKMPEITDENYVKARKKVVDTIMKDPDAYKDLQLANFKAVKEMDKDLEMKEVKKNNLNDKPNEMKVVKKDAKENTQATLEKKEKKKSKTAKVPVMTQTPKGKLEAFATPGKEKTLKKALNEALTEKEQEELETIEDELRYSVQSDSAISPSLYKRYKELKAKAKEVDEAKHSVASENKLKALKEHILDEMTTMNPHHEEFHKGMEVYKKKGSTVPGKVIEFDGHTATVEWENGQVEDVQRNVLTKNKPEKAEVPMPDKPRTMVQWSNESEKVGETSTSKDKIIAQLVGPDHPLAKKPENEWSEKEHDLFNKIQKMASEEGKVPAMKAEEKQSMLKKIKERLVKALQKEAGDVVKSQDGTILAVTSAGQGQNAARSIKTQSKGGINPIVTTVRS